MLIHAHTSIQTHTHTHTPAVPHTHTCDADAEVGTRRQEHPSSSPLCPPGISSLTSKVQSLEGGAGGERLGQRRAGRLPFRALQHVRVACRPRPAHVHTYTNIYPSVIVYLSHTRPKTRTARHSRAAGGIVLATPPALPYPPLSLPTPYAQSQKSGRSEAERCFGPLLASSLLPATHCHAAVTPCALHPPSHTPVLQLRSSRRGRSAWPRPALPAQQDPQRSCHNLPHQPSSACAEG